MNDGIVRAARRWRSSAAGLAVGMVAAMFAGGCASEPASPAAELDERFDDYEELIDETVEDPERAKKLKSILERVNSDFDAQADVIRSKQSALKEAARLYETTESELDSHLADLRSASMAQRKILRDGHYELHELVSEDEWNEIVNHRRKILGIF